MEASIPLHHTPFLIQILNILYLVVLSTGLLGNVLVIIALLKIPKIKTPTNYFILNLAIADLLALILCLSPSLISSTHVPWVLGSLMCKVVPYVHGVAIGASVFSLAAISGERLMTLRYPFRRQVTTTVARRLMLLIWIWAAGLSLPRLIYSDLSNSEGSQTSLVFCVENWPSQLIGNIYFMVVNVGLFFLFPLGFISVCHHICSRVLIRHRIATMDSSAFPMEHLLEKTRASVDTMIILFVGGFNECWLHLYVYFVRVKLIPAVQGTMEEQVLDFAVPIAQMFGAANSCINPILSAVFSQSFRFALQRLLLGSSACTTPRSGPSHVGYHQSKTAGCWTNWLRVKFNAALNRFHRSQLKNNCHNALELDVVVRHQNNNKLAIISRSQSY